MVRLDILLIIWEKEPWLRIVIHTESDNHTMDSRLLAAVTVPLERLVSKIKMDAETFKQRLPDTGYSSTLGNGTG